jgi:transcriptional regulator with XRE-family HTH domain
MYVRSFPEMIAVTANGNVGYRLRLLRQRGGIGLRELAQRAQVTPAMVSYVEHGKASPSVVTLEKLLGALGTDLAAFFGAEQPAPDGPVFPRETMRLIADDERSYTLVFPRAGGIGVEVLDELLKPGRPRRDFETLPCDVGGYVITGELTLEIGSRPPRRLRPGDAFYVPAGVCHRGFATGREPTRLMSFSLPARGGRRRARAKVRKPTRHED